LALQGDLEEADYRRGTTYDRGTTRAAYLARALQV
jgi:hypothetical protein